MGFEVDFLAVGEESSGGDAIALRYGDLINGDRSQQTVIVIDGGYKASGKDLVDLIRTHYGTESVDVVVSTHPDQDHISGLEVVLEELTVGTLLMHQPWRHSEAVREARASGFQAMAQVSEKLMRSLAEMSTLEQIANDRGVKIMEPFTGVHTPDFCFRVVGPTLDYYEELLPGIISPTSLGQRMSEMVVKARTALGTIVGETLHKETLRDDGITRPSNNSSVISLLEVDGRKILFTGDAGIPALERAMDQLEAEGHTPGDLSVVQIPHHGSRRNVGPTVLNRMLGSTFGDGQHSVAYVSAPRKNPDHKHPAKQVTNAFHRRGYAVHGTQGTSKRHHYQAPSRSGYSPSEPIPFHHQVEDPGDD